MKLLPPQYYYYRLFSYNSKPQSLILLIPQQFGNNILLFVYKETLDFVSVYSYIFHYGKNLLSSQHTRPRVNCYYRNDNIVYMY